MTTVTLSAAYGAGGSVVGPKLAAALGLPFLDRAIPASVADGLKVQLDTALAHDGRAERGLRRILAGGAGLPNLTLGGMDAYMPADAPPDEATFAAETARVLREAADTTGGVILGRAGAVVLAGRPDVLNVRLTGAVEARVAQARRLRDLDETTARERQRAHDGAREAYVKRLFGKDPTDPSLYHVVLNSTLLPLDACVDILTTAAHAFTARTQPLT